MSRSGLFQLVLKFYIFFQNTNIFDDSNTSGLSINANRIHTELHNISIEEIGKLWGNIGANYIPSVSYRFKHILFDGESISHRKHFKHIKLCCHQAL